MLVAITFKDKTLEVAVGKKGKNSKLKKHLTLELKEGQCRNGELVNPEMLGKEILVQLRRKKITPTEVMFAIRSNDIVVTEVSIPMVENKLVLQSMKIALSEKFPGVIEKNYLAYKIYNIVEDSFLGVAAMAPKAMVEGYYILANAMRCRLSKIDFYANCIAKAVTLEFNPADEDGRIFIDIMNDYIQVYYLQDGMIQMSNSFMAYQGLSSVEEEPDEESSVRDGLLNRLYQNVTALMSVTEEGSIKEIYLNHYGYFNVEEITYLKNQFQEGTEIELLTLQEIAPNFDEVILKGLLWEQKILSKDMNFALELDIDGGRNFTKVDLSVAGIAGLAIAAAATVTTLGFFSQQQIDRLNQEIAIHEAFIAQNSGIDEMYFSEISLKDELTYLKQMDQYIDATHYDYREIHELIQEALRVGGGTLEEISVGADLSVTIAASAANYRDIALTMQSLKEAQFKEVILQAVQPDQNKDVGAKDVIQYNIFAVYQIGSGEIDQTEIPEEGESYES